MSKRSEHNKCVHNDLKCNICSLSIIIKLPIHTRVEAQEIRYVASQAIILRYTWRECIEHIKSKTGHDLSKTAFFKIKKQLKSEGRDWVFRLRDDHDEFLYEYRQRYEELFAYQKELWDIAITNRQ